MKEKFSHKEIIENLKNHLLPCFHDLNEFDIQFSENELHIEMLDEIAPNFFLQLNRMYFDRFILAISRLLDPAKQSSFENLSMFQLIKIAEESNYEQIEELKQKLESIKFKSHDIIKLRSKYIAHRNLNHSINNDLNVETIEFDKIKEIFVEMSNCLNSIEAHLGLDKTSFIWMRDFDGTLSLLKHLKNALIYREMRIASNDWNEDENRASKTKFYKLDV